MLNCKSVSMLWVIIKEVQISIASNIAVRVLLMLPVLLAETVENLLSQAISKIQMHRLTASLA